jgi:glycosyltransferase involved in cell wall biosynthesis
LNFLHVTTFYPPYSFGGDAAYVYRLAAALADEGHNVDVVHSIDAYRVLHPAEPEFVWKEHSGVTVHGLHSRAKWLTTLTAHQLGRPYFQQSEILSVLNHRAYDVIHFHNISLFGPGILTLNPHRSRPLKIYTTHEHWLVCPMHVLWKFNERACESPECLACTLQAKRPPQVWRYTGLLERATSDVDLFLAPSRFAAEKHRERGFGRPFTVLPLFVDQDADEMPAAASPHPRPYVLYVGRLERLKGVETLLPAVAAGPDVDLLIVGAGVDEARLKAMAGSNPRVRFLGAVAPELLGPLYRHALASCIPSLTYEVFPTVAIESLARKTPIIARDLGGLTEIVRESGGGILYRDQAELAAALERIAGDAEARRAMGECGYRMVCERWSKRAHLQSYLGLIHAAARNGKGSAVRSPSS